MRELNQFFPSWRMRMEDLRHFPSIMRPDYFCFTLDIKAAYRTILSHPRLARYFGFEWDGVHYRWDCLPFGFRLSAYVFLQSR